MTDYRPFIQAKCNLFAAVWENPTSRANWDLLFRDCNGGPLSKTAARRIEAGMERFATLADADKVQGARQQLRARFGFDRIGVDPKVVIQGVLKRGRIRSDAEAAVVREAVANQANEHVLGSDVVFRLATILDEAGY